MKKLFIITLCLALLLAGCATKAPAPIGTTAPSSTPETAATQPATEPTETEPPVPETEAGTALADRTALILTTLDRGAAVSIVDEFDAQYYVIRLEDGYGLIEKRLVRMDGEEAYVPWTGYARSGAELFDNYLLLLGGQRELNKNMEVAVLEALGDVCLVQVGDTIGYMQADQISQTKIKSSGGGGSADGGDISLGSFGPARLSSFVPQSGQVTGQATVLADNVEVLLGWFDEGETLDIITEEGFLEEKEGFYRVYIGGLCGYVRQFLTAREGDEAYTEWDGFARSKAGVYANYYLSGEPEKTLSTNTSVHVVKDLGQCYQVTVDGQTGYMDKDTVSETKIQSSGGGGGNEWSDPVM